MKIPFHYSLPHVVINDHRVKIRNQKKASAYCLKCRKNWGYVHKYEPSPMSGDDLMAYIRLTSEKCTVSESELRMQELLS